MRMAASASEMRSQKRRGKHCILGVNPPKVSSFDCPAHAHASEVMALCHRLPDCIALDCRKAQTLNSVDQRLSMSTWRTIARMSVVTRHKDSWCPGRPVALIIMCAPPVPCHTCICSEPDQTWQWMDAHERAQSRKEL